MPDPITPQPISRDYLPSLKDWQAEAFIYVVLFCCINDNGSTRSGWNLSKICILYDLMGDIFDKPVVKAASQKVIKYMAHWECHEQLKINIRLLPKESRPYLISVCLPILERFQNASDFEIVKIITEELS